FGDPAAHRAATEPFVLEQAEEFQVIEPLHILEWIEIERYRFLQPERRAGIGAEMPADDLAHLRVELLAGLTDFGLEGRGHSCTHAGNASPNRMNQLCSARWRRSAAASMDCVQSLSLRTRMSL